MSTIISSLPRVPNPVNPLDVANKQYVDAHQGPTIHGIPARLAGSTTLAVPSAAARPKLEIPGWLGLITITNNNNDLGRFPVMPPGHTFDISVLRAGRMGRTPSSGNGVLVEWTANFQQRDVIGAITLPGGTANEFVTSTDISRPRLSGGDLLLVTLGQNRATPLADMIIYFEAIGTWTPPAGEPVPEPAGRVAGTLGNIKDRLANVINPIRRDQPP